jgi:hypothetical protein
VHDLFFVRLHLTFCKGKAGKFVREVSKKKKEKTNSGALQLDTGIYCSVSLNIL